MLEVSKTVNRVWKSAQLYIGFHRDQEGNARSEAKVWPPKNGNASIHAQPDVQEAFLVVKSSKRDDARDVQVKLRPDQIVLRRDAGPAWEGVVIEDHMISVQVNGVEIEIVDYHSENKMITFANTVHPGKVLRMQFLDDTGLTAGKVAKAIFVPRTLIEGIVKEEMGVTADTASRLARFFGTSVEFWMNLQRSYDLDMAAKDAALVNDLNRIKKVAV